MLHPFAITPLPNKLKIYSVTKEETPEKNRKLGEIMASKKKDIRPVITLECTECKERNYATTKNVRNTTGRLEISKFCKKDHKHTVHRETK